MPSQTAIHVVTAFPTRLGLVFGQEKESAKSSEITSIPERLDALYLQGFLVSIDAMGCLRAIAKKVIARAADYLLAVKGNQPSLHKAIQDAFLDRKDQLVHLDQAEQRHFRGVAQHCSVLPATGIVPESNWPRYEIDCRIDSVRQFNGKQSTMEQRYYIASRHLASGEVAEAVRSHRGIENQLHWVLYVTIKEDTSAVHKEHAPENISLLKKIVHNPLRVDTTDNVKSSLRQKRKRATWDDDLRMNSMSFRPL